MSSADSHRRQAYHRWPINLPRHPSTMPLHPYSCPRLRRRYTWEVVVHVVLATFIFESDLQAPRVLLTQFCRHHPLFQFLYECGISWIIHRSERSIVLHLEAISPQNDLDVLCALGSWSLTSSRCSRATSSIPASLSNQVVEIVVLAL